MQLASEAALAAPTEADASGSQTTPEPIRQNLTRLSIQNLFNLAYHANLPGPVSFAPTRSVRTLARYLDMCLMRQRELRMADLLVSSVTRRHQAQTAAAEVGNHGKNRSTSSRPSSQTDHDLRYPFSYGRSRQRCGCRLLCRCAPCLARCCPRTSHAPVVTTGMPMDKSVASTSSEDNVSHAGRTKMSNCTNASSTHRSDRYSTRSAHTTVEEAPNLRSNYSRIRPRFWLGCLCCGRYQGNFLVRLHMFVKLLYLCNAVGQIILLEYYTGVQYNFYGIRVLYDLARGRQWEESGHFPRVTFCDFEARKLAQSHYYTLQCVLPINMFLEKIYIFLWLWFFLVSLITFASILVWIARMGSKRCRFVWIRHQLITIRQFTRSSQNCAQFVENHLGPDGVFILRLIAQNYGDLVAGDTLGELWTAYWQRRGEKAPAGHEGSETQTRQRLKEVGKQDSSKVRQVLPPRNYNNLRNEDDMNNSSRPSKSRDSKRRVPTGYSATLMATELIHPAVKSAVPFITSSRKPPSIHSHDSSRYSQNSRVRSDSPPPIPQRSSEIAESSLIDRRSFHEVLTDSHSTAATRTDSPAKFIDAEDLDVHDRPDTDVDQHPPPDFDQEVGLNEREPELQEFANYGQHYGEDFQHDDNIV